MKILAVDVGGTHVKILATGEKQKREIVSGPRMTARQMVSSVKNIESQFVSGQHRRHEKTRRGQPFKSYSRLSRAAICSTISRRSASSTDPSCTTFTFQLSPSG